MNKFGILTKLYLKQYFGMPDDPRAKKKKIGAMVGIGACFIPLIAMLCFGISSVAGFMLQRGQAHYLLGAIMFMAQMLILFFGLATFLSIMFYSKDNEFLSTLPVRTTTIYMSKMLIVYLTHLVTSLAILIPSIIMVAITAGVKSFALGAEYYILGLIAIPIVPLLPLLLISIVAMPLAWIGRLFRRSQLVNTILVVVLFIGVMVAYMAGMASLGTSFGDNADLGVLIDSMVNTFKTLSMVMYPNLFIAKAMMGISWAVNALIYFVIVLGAGAIAIFLSMLMYKKNSVRFLEVGVKSKGKNKELKTNSSIKALILRDIKGCMRETSLALNCVLGLFMAPVMVGLFGFIGGGGEIGSYSAFMIFMMGVVILIGSNYLATIAITREGEKFYIIKYLPIRTEEYIKAKRYLANAYVLLGAVLVGIVVIFTKIHFIAKIAVVLNIFLFGMAMTDLAIERDLKKPKLNWINIKQAIKSRFAVMVPMIIGMVEAMVVMLLSIMLPMVVKSQLLVEFMQWGLITLTNAVLMIVFMSKLKQNQLRLFAAIEANNG